MFYPRIALAVLWAVGFSVGIEISSFNESSVFDKLDIVISPKNVCECNSVSDF